MVTDQTSLHTNAERRRKRWSKLFLLGFLGLLIILVTFVAFLRHPQFQINQISVLGVQSIDPDTITKKTEQYLKDQIIWIIPKSNALLFSKQSLENFIKESFPGIDTVDIFFSERNHITIHITEKLPSFVWCLENDCYFVDHEGVRYKKSPHYSNGVFIIFKGELLENPESIYLHKPFISSELFNHINGIIDILETYSFNILTIEYLSQDNNDIVITVDTVNDLMVQSRAKIFITQNTTIDTIKTVLDPLLNDKSFIENLKQKGEFLDYIDLRFPQKVYYKFKNETASNAPKKE